MSRKNKIYNRKFGAVNLHRSYSQSAIKIRRRQQWRSMEQVWTSNCGPLFEIIKSDVLAGKGRHAQKL